MREKERETCLKVNIMGAGGGNMVGYRLHTKERERKKKSKWNDNTYKYRNSCEPHEMKR